MDYVLVYRCESISNRFEGGNRFTASEWFYKPTPTQDGIDYNIIQTKYKNDKWYCGCSDLKQFFKWWPKSKLKHNKKHNNRVVILRVPKDDVTYGKTQVIFKRHKAKIVGHVNEKGEAIFNSNYMEQKGTTT